MEGINFANGVLNFNNILRVWNVIIKNNTGGLAQETEIVIHLGVSGALGFTVEPGSLYCGNFKICESETGKWGTIYGEYDIPHVYGLSFDISNESFYDAVNMIKNSAGSNFTRQQIVGNSNLNTAYSKIIFLISEAARFEIVRASIKKVISGSDHYGAVGRNKFTISNVLSVFDLYDIYHNWSQAKDWLGTKYISIEGLYRYAFAPAHANLAIIRDKLRTFAENNDLDTQFLFGVTMPIA